MIISIKTKPRNRPSSVSTCANEAKIYLYVSQKNCTMDEASDNYCQKCIDEYGKYDNNCYHRSEKFTNLYYDEHSQTFKQCEINNTIYNCSICPKGSYIFENNTFSSTCKKCPEWKYNDNVDQYECIPCVPHCVECNTKGICLKCNTNSLNGLDNCSLCENKIGWEYDGEFCKTKCSKYFYRDNNNNIYCIQEIDECPKDMIYLNLETGECRKEVSDFELIKGKYQLKLKENQLEKETDNLLKKVANDKDLFNEIPENGIKIEGYNEIITMGIVNNDSIKTDLKTINLGECPHLLRANLNIIGPEQSLLYKIIDFKYDDTNNSIRFYNSEYLDKPKNISYCENENITYITSYEDALPYLKYSKYENIVLTFIEQGLDIFNAYSPIYNDPCYPLSIINKFDLTLNDRRKDMIKLNLTVCKPGCSIEGANNETREVLCFCKDYINTEQKSLSDGFTEGFINLGKSKNIMVFKCIKSVFNNKNNYISEIIILFFIIEIICGFNCERGIKKYIKNLINSSLESDKENNDDSTILVNHNDNIILLIISFLKKIFELFLLYFKEDHEITNIFIAQNNDDYNEINITPIKIIIFMNKILITLLLNTLFLDDEAMHNIRENNGKYNLIYRLPIIFFSELASWIICLLFFELPISSVNLSEFKNNIRELEVKYNNQNNQNKINYCILGEFNIIIKKFNKKFMKKRIVIYIFSLIIFSISWYYISCFFSIFENTQIHLLKDFGSGLLMNLIISLVKSFLYGIYKYILERIYNNECFYKFLNALYDLFDQKFVVFIFEVFIEILIIHISKQFNYFQNIQNLFD